MSLQRGKGPQRPCALLWDESFLWGVMARLALAEAGLPFELIRAEDVRGGGLSRYRMLFVPGGWASNKLGDLGTRGQEEIRRFVAAGGSYLGICGGAEMAVENVLWLLKIRRKSSQDRVPSFSGPILLVCDDHPIWNGGERPIFWAWWPSQFERADPPGRVLGRYGRAQAGAFSSDIPVADGEALGWPELEERYGIILDPARLCGEPAEVEGTFGKGKVILSLVHFDTPADVNGRAVLRNIWGYLASCPFSPEASANDTGQVESGLPTQVLADLEEIKAAVRELIDLGLRNFLWQWRNPLTLMWRRGVRGVECSTLAVLVGEIDRSLGRAGAASGNRSACKPPLDLSLLGRELQEIRTLLIPFLRESETAAHTREVRPGCCPPVAA